jgi:hypothetical protein
VYLTESSINLVSFALFKLLIVVMANSGVKFSALKLLGILISKFFCAVLFNEKSITNKIGSNFLVFIVFGING